jgi:amino acid transporter
VLARIHPRHQTPYVSTLCVAGVSLLVGLSFAAHMDDLSRIVNFGALSSFLLLHGAVINHYFMRRKSGDWLRHMLAPLVGAAVIGFVLYEMDRSAKIMGACWIAVGAVYYTVLTVVLRKPAELGV